MVSWAGGSLFITPTSERAIGEIFTRQVWWASLESDEKLSGSRPSPMEASRVRLEPLESSLRPDKSGGAL
jgi:hypothetical protein